MIELVIRTVSNRVKAVKMNGYFRQNPKTNRFVYYRPRFVTALCLVLEHKSAKLDLLAVTDTLRNRELLVLTDLCLEKYTQ